MKNFVLALAVLVLAPTLALAGGGGTKANATIQVTNTGSSILAVILDNATPPQDPNGFASAGGKILAAGEVATFKNLKSGSHTVYAAVINPNTSLPIPGSQTGKTYSLSQGQFLALNASADVNNVITISKQ